MDKERKFRALIVDDNAEIRKLISWALNREAIACDEAGDGVTASNMAAIKRYDVVITDLAMPRMHGHKLIVELVQRESPPLILVVTGVTDTKIIHDLFMRGVEDVFFKPLTMELFSAKVKALVQRNADRKQAGTAWPAPGLSAAAPKPRLTRVQEEMQKTIDTLEAYQEQLETNFVGSVRVLTSFLTQAVDARGSHTVRVEAMAVSLAEQFGLSAREMTDLKIAALLHDIGQVGMPDSLRRKAPWDLDAGEREVYRKYPILGSLLLSGVPGGDGIAALVESHAENFDGSGFPAGLRGSAISLSARLLRIADGLDTFLMYTNGEDTGGKGEEHLNAEAGKLYDPDLIPFSVTYLRELVMAEQLKRTRKIPAPELAAGHVVAENLYDDRGRLLLRKGATVSEHIVAQVKSLSGIQSVVVEA